MEEDVEVADKEMDMGEAPPIEHLVPEQAQALPATVLEASRIWVGGPSGQVAGQGPAASERAQGKAPTVQAE